MLLLQYYKLYDKQRHLQHNHLSQQFKKVLFLLHYHTVHADSEEILDEIQEELQKAGFLAQLQEYEPVDKIEIDYRIKEAIQMHDKYISSDESYQEYLDRLDNEILLRSRDRKIEEANNEKDNLLSKTKENIIKYIKMQFHEDISDFISNLSKQQILNIQDHLYDYTSIEEFTCAIISIKEGELWMEIKEDKPLLIF